MSERSDAKLKAACWKALPYQQRLEVLVLQRQKLDFFDFHQLVHSIKVNVNPTMFYFQVFVNVSLWQCFCLRLPIGQLWFVKLRLLCCDHFVTVVFFVSRDIGDWHFQWFFCGSKVPGVGISSYQLGGLGGLASEVSFDMPCNSPKTSNMSQLIILMFFYMSKQKIPKRLESLKKSCH